MNPYNFSVLCFGFCSLLLGIFVWLKRQDYVGRLYFALSFFYAGWAIFISINLNNDISPDLGLLMGRLGNGFAIFISIIWYHFVLVYTGFIEKHYKLVKFFYIISILTFCFVFSPWFIPKTATIVGFKHYSQAGPIHYFFSFLFFILVTLSFIELHRKIKNSFGYERAQFKGLFWTALLGYLGGSPAFLPIYGIPMPQYCLFLMPLYPFMLAYFMTKQKLFDVAELAQAAHRDKLSAIGLLAASINHEVKNPLFVIKGMTETQLERLHDPTQSTEKLREMLEKTLQQADRALGIIRSFSEYAKRQSSRTFDKQMLDIREVIDNIIPFVRSELALDSIHLELNIPAKTMICADQQSMEEIFLNLIVNACQAIKSTNKTGEIEISSEKEDPWIRIAVRDTGPGLSQDQLSRIFEPFYTTKVSGTGLGLYVVKQLVEKNQGRIEVVSKIGVGTTFTLIFSQH
ncbi:MAG TPA: ATP-binding protein [Candidatus Omnitrophota bacterium]|nr:ATP-binding protein [Candidatus Omnitrophota bacterium]